MEPVNAKKAAGRVATLRRLAQRRREILARIAEHHQLPVPAIVPRSLASTTHAVTSLAFPDPAPSAARATEVCPHSVRASSCCRSDSRTGRCLASISRDVRRTQCEVAAQGGRVVADLDLLRTQLLARLRRIETSLHALAGTPITPAEILAAPGGTFVIASPGHYTLAGDVVVPSTPSNTAPLIDIRADDVVLDLGSFVLHQPDATLTTGRVAIQISGPGGAGARNVTVQNGTLRGFGGPTPLGTYAAVYVARGSDLVTLQRLQFVDVSTDASFATGPPPYAITAVYVSNLIVRESVFERVRGHGLSLLSVQGLLVEDVLMTQFLPWITGGFYLMYGISFSDSAEDITVSNDITVRRVIFEDFHLVAPASAPGAIVSAIILTNSREPVAPVVGVVTRGVLFEDILVRRFSSSGGIFGQVFCVYVSGSYAEATPEVRSDPTDCVYRRLVVQDVSVAVPAAPDAVALATGLWLFSQPSVVEDCVVQNVAYTGSVNLGADAFMFLYGIHFRGHGFVLRRCTATGLDGTRFGPNPGTDVTGMETCICGVDGGLVEQNYSGANTGVIDTVNATGFGAYSNVDTVWRNNVAADNNSSGFYIADATVPSQNNLFASNTVTGSVSFGFGDFTTDSNNAYIDNFARSAFNNYLGNNGPNDLYGAQIVQWTIPEPAPTGSEITKLTNLSVNP